MIVDIKFDEDNCSINPDFTESDCNVNINFEQVNVISSGKGAVKTVNGISPDENGNVEVDITGVVNDALEQAKASGEFKGEPGDDYVLTEADKTEIAEQTAGMVEIPECDAVKTVNGVTPDENGNVEIETTPDELEQIALLTELDMLPAVHDTNGTILTDENGNIILRY